MPGVHGHWHLLRVVWGASGVSEVGRSEVKRVGREQDVAWSACAEVALIEACRVIPSKPWIAATHLVWEILALFDLHVGGERDGHAGRE